MPTSIAAHVLRKQMALDGADPFEIAADALLRIAALEAQLAVISAEQLVEDKESHLGKHHK